MDECEDRIGLDSDEEDYSVRDPIETPESADAYECKRELSGSQSASDLSWRNLVAAAQIGTEYSHNCDQNNE